MANDILDIKAREILDSRGNPTVEVDLKTKSGTVRAMVPSGASTGTHEALELRDGGSRYLGKGVLKAVKNVNEVIAPALKGMNCLIQKDIDKKMAELDGTDNKSKLGANAILGVSMAVCKAGALFKGLPLYGYIAAISNALPISLPIPQFNVINGGKHAGINDDIQENMLMPVGAPSFAEALRMSTETYHILHKMLKEKFGAAGIHLGDEGGFVPPMKNAHERLEIMTKAIEEAGYAKNIYIAIDSAASEFFKDGKYTLGGKKYSSGELVDFYFELCDTFDIISIEDGMAEDDWNGWIALTKKIGHRVQITGDDLLVTNVKRIKRAIELSAVNSLLLKVNQIGTVTEAIEAAKMAMKNRWGVTVSHRSGETEDSFIADLAVGLGAGQIKSGAPARSERLAKYNQLLRIEEALGKNAKYFGSSFKFGK